MKLSIQLFLFLLLAFTSLAQVDLSSGKIEGQILTTDQQPAPFVNVQLKNTRIGVVTDESGRFSIATVKPGQYTLLATGVGFETLRETITVEAGQTTQAHFQIKTAVQQLQTVEITGRKETSYKNDYSFSATKTQVRSKTFHKPFRRLRKS
ncbi:carboxypeptidase-like regulatory domain-containing protein [Larkinella sp. VNQ87]|uniref:carboxypeptidase-like regulatory domain-containing protein n=1 Tax=Larkinella sp. VNQ87 TaxID=3400921 RepID=UPI003C11ADAD